MGKCIGGWVRRSAVLCRLASASFNYNFLYQSKLSLGVSNTKQLHSPHIVKRVHFASCVYMLFWLIKMLAKILVLASAFTRSGLSRHHQSSWPRRGWRRSRLDGPVRVHKKLSPNPFFIVRSNTLNFNCWTAVLLPLPCRKRWQWRKIRKSNVRNVLSRGRVVRQLVISCAKCYGPREYGLAYMVLKQGTSSNARFVNHVAHIPAGYACYEQ